MNVVFRVDASVTMGIGHAMRCLTLADELKSHSADTTFVIRAHKGHLEGMIRTRGHKAILLPAPTIGYESKPDDVDHSHWLGVHWNQDAQETRQAMGAIQPDWLVVDHYGIDARWHRVLRDHVCKILVIDDLADRDLDCDVLLDQTYGRTGITYEQRVPGSCRMLLGSRYALLRPKFAKLRPLAVQRRRRFDGIRRILVSMGGMDSDNVTDGILKALARVHWKKPPAVDIILSSKAPHLKSIRQGTTHYPLKTTVSADVDDMAERMLEADLAIGAGGTTLWERCCLGLPTLIFVSADNQKEASENLDSTGAVILLRNSLPSIVDEIEPYINHSEHSDRLLARMSMKSFGITDGLGRTRVALEMKPPSSKDGKPIRLRPFEIADADLLFRWQSNPKTRRYSHNPTSPSHEEHLVWAKKRVDSTYAYTEIILHDDEPAGVIMLDPLESDKTSIYLISIYISPNMYRLGIGTAALFIVTHLMADSELRAEIHEENIASCILFQKAGFSKLTRGQFIKPAATLP